MAGVVADVKRPFEPAFVEPGPIGVDAFDDCPGIAEAAAQPVVGGEPGGEILQGHTADWLVGVRQRKEQRPARPVADAQGVDRLAGARIAGDEEVDDSRVVVGQRLTGSAHFIDGQKCAVIGDIGKDALDLIVGKHGHSSRAAKADVVNPPGANLESADPSIGGAHEAEKRPAGGEFILPRRL